MARVALHRRADGPDLSTLSPAQREGLAPMVIRWAAWSAAFNRDQERQAGEHR
jgi:hypothetical protein